MNKKILKPERIDEIISESQSISGAIVNLYKEVIDVKWEDILTWNKWPHVNYNTALFILDAMAKKWDKLTVNMLWLNKGFSSFHDELNDWEVVIPDDAYELIGPEGVHKPSLDDFSAVKSSSDGL